MWGCPVLLFSFSPSSLILPPPDHIISSSSHHLLTIFSSSSTSSSSSSSGSRSTCTWSIEVRGRLATSWVTWAPLAFAGRGTYGASQCHFAWQAQHLEPLQLVLRGRRSTWSIPVTATHLHSMITSTSTLHYTSLYVSVVATIHLSVSCSSSTKHHIHCIMHATSQHHFINPSPSTQHHLHKASSSNTISRTSSDIGTLAALILDCSCFCFADVVDKWFSLDIANTWGYPVIECKFWNVLSLNMSFSRFDASFLLKFKNVSGAKLNN